MEKKRRTKKMEKIGKRHGGTVREKLPGNVHVNTIPTISQNSLIKYVLFIYLFITSTNNNSNPNVILFIIFFSMFYLKNIYFVFTIS